MNRKRLVVVLEDQIYLYDISNMKLLYTIETSPNPNGIQHMLIPKDYCLLIRLSYMHPLAFLGKLLSSISPPPESSALLLRTTISCPTWHNTYRSY